MARVSQYLLLVSGLVFGLVACSSDEHHHGMRSGQRPTQCELQTTCGTCTPIMGCGWCQYEDGTGSCATGPSACRELSFRWNWEPTDCPVPSTDAGLTPADAAPVVDSGALASDADTGAADTGTTADSGGDSDFVDTASPIDASCRIPAAASAVCAPTTGGTLCPSDRYTLGCHATGGSVPTPDTALGCVKAYSAGGETYYCCPCL